MSSAVAAAASKPPPGRLGGGAARRGVGGAVGAKKRPVSAADAAARRRTAEARRAAASQFAMENMARYLDDVERTESFKEAHRHYLRGIESLERDILDRSVVIWAVRGGGGGGGGGSEKGSGGGRGRNAAVAGADAPLLDADTVSHLAERYGPMERCTATMRRGDPALNVTFRSGEDALRMFHRARSMEQARRQRAVADLRIPDEIGGGTVRAEPAKWDRGSVTAHKSDLRFESLRLSLGHFVPPEDDDGDPFRLRAEARASGASGLSPDLGPKESAGAECEFLEEVSFKSGAQVKINATKKLVDIELDHGELRFIPAGKFKPTGFVGQRYRLTFRFKALQGRMHLVRDPSGSKAGFSLAFRLHYPPRLYKMSVGKDPVRCDDFVWNFHGPFGRCLGLRLHLSLETARNLLREVEFLKTLNSFSFIRGKDFSLEGARIICSREVGYEHQGMKEIDPKLKCIKSRKIAFLAKAVLDCGKISWIHVVTDSVRVRDRMRPRKFLDMVNSATPEDAQRALESMLQMHSSTPYPAKVVARLLGLDVGEPGTPSHGLDDSSRKEKEKSVEPDEAAAASTPTDTIALGTLPPVPPHCLELGRVLVTPTRVAVIGVEVEVSNRVVRHFTENEGFAPEDFIRVSFGDEDCKKFYGNDLSPPVCHRIRERALRGIEICGREYDFLAYSSSQIKDKSIWMVSCPVGSGWTVDKIRDWMGDFSGITNPSKYAARLGQCFSSTVGTVEGSGRWRSADLEAVRIFDNMYDIMARQRGRGRGQRRGGEEGVHSDGTGLISREALLRALKNVPFCPRNPNDVSIVQVRLGGAKGTLTAWDLSSLWQCPTFRNDRLPKTADVYLRRSMVKFQAPYRNLEIVSIGKHGAYFLNRQLIMLLEVHKVPGTMFINMQRQMLDDLDKMLECADTAKKVLPVLCGPDDYIISLLMHLMDAGWTPLNEPFLFSCLHAIRSYHLLINLRKRTRVIVEDGAVLLGGLDETGVVPEGCVFLQVRPEGNSSERIPGRKPSPFEVITGPVMVAKHPVMHPGDARMLLAIDVPELRGHKNVILFSQHGARPEASKMAGSDLDGDQFAITWDRRLFLNQWNDCTSVGSGVYLSRSGKRLSVYDLQKSNHSPLPVAPKGNPKHVDVVKNEHMIDHFINHAKSDTLSTICLEWLDWASKKKRADCNECIELAKLHTTAVDFPKTGIPAIIPSELRIGGHELRAHWREKKNAKTYHCPCTVGKMYDETVARINKGKKISKRIQSAVAGRRWNARNQLVCFSGKNSRKKVHGQLKKLYRAQVSRTLGLIPQNESLKVYNGDECFECIKWASFLRGHYEDLVIALMSRYTIYSEGELCTGCITKTHNLSKRRQHDTYEEIRRQYRQLRLSTRTAFFTHVLEKAQSTVSQKERSILESMGSTTEGQEELMLMVEASALSDTPWHRHQFTVQSAENRGFTLSVGTTTSIRRYARKLAAACYEVTYHPDLRCGEMDNLMGGRLSSDILSKLDGSTAKQQNMKGYMLYSFPTVFADVISAGMRGEMSCTESLSSPPSDQHKDCQSGVVRDSSHIHNDLPHEPYCF